MKLINLSVDVKKFGLTLKAHGMCMFWRREKGGPGGFRGYSEVFLRYLIEI